MIKKIMDQLNKYKKLNKMLNLNIHFIKIKNNNNNNNNNKSQ